MNAPLNIVQITDLHIAHPPRTLPDSTVTTEQSLRTVLETIARDEAPEFMLCTGDLANHPEPAAYALLHRIVGDDGCPIYWLPGNHDDPEMAMAAGRSRLRWDGHVLAGNWLIVMLDSHREGRIDGWLAAAELRRLDATLTRHRDHHALVCLHHHPVPMESRWLDHHILKNREAFLTVIDRHPNVRGIVWGHVHQPWEGRHGDIRLIGTPSTCFQFLPRQADFAFDTRPPAYRRFRLLEDGNFTTELIFCELSL